MKYVHVTLGTGLVHATAGDGEVTLCAIPLGRHAISMRPVGCDDCKRIIGLRNSREHRRGFGIIR